MNGTGDSAPGAVELREDVPLKAGVASGAGGSGEWCAGGPRLILACFATLSAAITLALFTQIYSGDYEVVPHGGVSTDAAACSGAGTDALKAGGRALDAAVVAALCLVVTAPHRTSLDASGFLVSEGLASALAHQGSAAPLAGSLRTAPELAAYLESVQRNTSAELSQSWNSDSLMSVSEATATAAGAWRVYAGGAAAVRRALGLALQPPPASPDEAASRVVSALQREAVAGAGAWPPAPGGRATGLAVVDSADTYVALVTGLPSEPQIAEGAGAGEGARPDLTPAIMLDGSVCGTRYVLGGASGAALAQAAAVLAAGGDVERPRVALLPGGGQRAEAEGDGDAVNVVRQRQDALLSHADSRGGGLASRF